MGIGFIPGYGRMRDAEGVPTIVRSFQDAVIIHLPVIIDLAGFESRRVRSGKGIRLRLVNMNPFPIDCRDKDGFFSVAPRVKQGRCGKDREGMFHVAQGVV